MVLGRKTKLVCEMVLGRKTNFPMENKKHLFGVRLVSQKMYLWFSRGKVGLSVQKPSFPSKRLVFRPKTIVLESWYSQSKTKFS